MNEVTVPRDSLAAYSARTSRPPAGLRLCPSRREWAAPAPATSWPQDTHPRRRGGSGGGDSCAAGAEMLPAGVTPAREATRAPQPGLPARPPTAGPLPTRRTPPRRPSASCPAGSTRAGFPGHPTASPPPHNRPGAPARPDFRRLRPDRGAPPAPGACGPSPAMSRTPPLREVHHDREQAGDGTSRQTKGAAMLESGGTDLAGFPAATSAANTAPAPDPAAARRMRPAAQRLT